MTESALALREHPQIIELLSVLEQHSLSKQKEEVQALVGYIDGMEEKLSQMMDEMKAMRLEVEKLHNKGIRTQCAQLVGTAEEKIRQGKAMLSTARTNFVSAAGRMLGTFQEKGRAALRHAVQALRIPAVLSRMERGFSHASQAMEQCAGKLDVIRDELHQAGGHMKNAGRTLAGKEALEAQELEADKGALARLRGLFASCGKTFAPDGARRGPPCGKSRRRKIFRKNRAAGAETGPRGAAPPGSQ